MPKEQMAPGPREDLPTDTAFLLLWPQSCSGETLTSRSGRCCVFPLLILLCSPGRKPTLCH